MIIIGLYFFIISSIFQLETIFCRRLLPNIYPFITYQCFGASDGKYPYPYNCSIFIECDHGNAIIKVCGLGTGFDRRHNHCDYDHNIPECYKWFRPGNTMSYKPLFIPDQLQSSINLNQQLINNNHPFSGLDLSSRFSVPQQTNNHQTLQQDLSYDDSNDRFTNHEKQPTENGHKDPVTVGEHKPQWQNSEFFVDKDRPSYENNPVTSIYDNPPFTNKPSKVLLAEHQQDHRNNDMPKNNANYLAMENRNQQEVNSFQNIDLSTNPFLSKYFNSAHKQRSMNWDKNRNDLFSQAHYRKDSEKNNYKFVNIREDDENGSTDFEIDPRMAENLV